MYRLTLEKSMNNPSTLIERRVKHMGSENDRLVNMMAEVCNSFLIASVFLEKGQTSSAKSEDKSRVEGLKKERIH